MVHDKHTEDGKEVTRYCKPNGNQSCFVLSEKPLPGNQSYFLPYFKNTPGSVSRCKNDIHYYHVTYFTATPVRKDIL